MRNAVILLLLILMYGCKSDLPAKNEKLTDGNVLGIADYQQIVRHPISLESNIDTSLWSNIAFNEVEYLFDTVVAGEIISKTFEFMNSGSKPLYILDTRVSCGCTAVAHSKEAIDPGETGTIDVEFDTFGKSGVQNKSIIVLSNSHPNEDKLMLRGYVKSK